MRCHSFHLLCYFTVFLFPQGVQPTVKMVSVFRIIGILPAKVLIYQQYLYPYNYSGFYAAEKLPDVLHSVRINDGNIDNFSHIFTHR